MGGPCLCGGRTIKPGTDNFELKPFQMQGVQYWSAEQAYQAIKMANKRDRSTIAKLVPKKGETAWNHGMRVWQKGQLLKKRRDWEAVKIEAMYYANKVKIQQNPDCLEALLATRHPFTHAGSGPFWDYWNPMLLERIREEIRPDGSDSVRVAAIREEMDTYRRSKGSERSLLEELSSSSGLTEEVAPESMETSPEAEDEDTDDARLSPERLLQAFQTWDLNGDGYIQKDELMKAMLAIGLAEEKTDMLFEAADLDKDGAINYEEFSTWLIGSAPSALRDAAACLAH